MTTEGKERMAAVMAAKKALKQANTAPAPAGSPGIRARYKGHIETIEQRQRQIAAGQK